MNTDKKQYVIIHAKPYDNAYVLLVMKDRPAWQKGFLNLVGGKVEPGEDITKAAFRELKEETGYSPSHLSIHAMDKMGVIEGDNEIVHCFKCPVDNCFQGDPKPRPGETEVVRWYPWVLVKDDKRLIPSLRVVLPLMLAGVYDWKLYVKDSFMSKGDNITQLTVPGYTHERFKERKGVTEILEKGQLDSKWEMLHE